MEAKNIKWCPQHGYPLPCYKCGMPLSQPQQKEIYEAGKQAGIREVVDWITTKREGGYNFCVKISWDDWEAKLKEWGIK